MKYRTTRSFHFIVLCLLYQEIAAFLGHLGSESDVNIEFKWPGTMEASVSGDEDADYTFTMTTMDKEKYKCVLPKLEEADQQENSKKYDGPSPYHLLKQIFSKNICTYRVESFWSYELCHGHYLLQFHPEANTKKLQHLYNLGKIEASSDSESEGEPTEDPVQTFAELPKIRLGDMDYAYYAMNMTDGTYCDVSGKSRLSRILYVCHKDGDNRIYSLRETSSCEYEVVVRSTLLCDHPAFKEKPEIKHYVYCYSYPDSPQKPIRLKSMFGPKKKTHTESTKEEIFTPFPGTATETDLPLDDSKKERKIVEPVTKPVASVPETSKTYPSDPKLVEDFLNGDYCLRGGSKDSWWKYEFCYGIKVQQYHQEPNGAKSIILLGVWNLQRHSEWLENHPENKIMPHKVPKQIIHLYSNGQFCDEKNKPREVAVKLKCKELAGHPNYVEMFLTEPQTCSYELTVASPLICSLLDKVDEKGVTSGLYNTLST